MLKLRTDVAYVSPTGRMTQAGVEAIQGQLDEGTAAVAALDTRVDAIEAGTLSASFVRLQTPIAAAGQTSIDFTGIPSWVKRITVMFSGFRTSGTSVPLIQIGDSGGVETTGYLGAGSTISAGASAANFTTGCGLGSVWAATLVIHGSMQLNLMNASTNLWAFSGHTGRSSDTGSQFGASSKALSATLDRVRITTVGGVDTFDAGSVSISWE